jgi:glutamate carboxypeptidase
MDSDFESRLEAAFAHLSSQQSTMVDCLRCWCDQNSGSYHRTGLDQMAQVLEQDFQALELPVQRIPSDPFHWTDDLGLVQTQQSSDLLLVDYRPEATRRVLMMIHYDTVYPRGSAPASCRLDAEGRLTGPGVADAKGGLLVMLEAMKTLKRFELDAGIGWTMVVNPDEEIGSPGSSRWMRENAKRFEFGLVFEPTLPDGALVASRKGSGNFTVVVRGRSAHAGRHPEQGRNAVVHLCRLLDQIDQWNGQFGATTFNVAKIQGGTALNQVPDLAIGRFNVRVADRESQSLILQQINKLVTTFDNVDGFRVTLEGEFQSPPKPVDEPTRTLQGRVERACRRLNRSVSWKPTGGACDGSKLAAAGLPNIDTMGPTGDCLHSAAEWVDSHTLVSAAQTVVALMAEFAQAVRAEDGNCNMTSDGQ